MKGPTEADRAVQKMGWEPTVGDAVWWLSEATWTRATLTMRESARTRRRRSVRPARAQIMARGVKLWVDERVLVPRTEDLNGE